MGIKNYYEVQNKLIKYIKYKPLIKKFKVKECNEKKLLKLRKK